MSTSPASARTRDRIAVATLIPICLLLALLSACGDGRPGVETARADFTKRYPDATILEVGISEDEVVARSFRIRYRKRSDDREGVVEIQYMKNKAGQWVWQPEPPQELK
jgi:hypothetical protein